MKVRIEKIVFPIAVTKEERICFIVKYKRHWWQRWHYIKDGSVPRLFEKIKDIVEYLESAGYTFKNYYAVFTKI